MLVLLNIYCLMSLIDQRSLTHGGLPMLPYLHMYRACALWI